VVHTKEAQHEDAERFFRKVIEARPRRWSEDHTLGSEVSNDFGVLRREQEDYDEGEGS
jgi:hypothetical protein